MSAQAIDNTNMKRYLGKADLIGFLPKLSYSVSGTNVTVTEQSTFGEGDDLKVTHVRLHDKFGGQVNGSIAKGGSGYTGTPTVGFSGGAGTGAAATAVVTNGKVTGVNVTNGGSGYTGAPVVTLTGGGGTGATAVATVVGGVVTAVTLSSSPIVLSSSGLDRSEPLSLTATVISQKECVADGSAKNIGATGELGHWDEQKNNIL